MILSRDILEEVLARALRHGGDFAEIFLEDRLVNTVTAEEEKIESVTSGRTAGAGVRLVSEGKTYYAYCSSLEREPLMECAETVSMALKGRAREITVEIGPARPTLERPELIPPAGVDFDRKVERVRQAEQLCRARDEKIVQVKAVYGDVTQHVEIANSLGEYVEDDRIRTRFLVQAVARDAKGNIQTGYDAEGSSSGYEFIRDLDTGKLAVQAADRALTMLRARPAPAGKMPVVMAAEAGGTMVHEACGHGLEADLVERGMSVYGGKTGLQVASSLITVIDDGNLDHRYGQQNVDDEGTPTRENVLIDQGILRGFMSDRISGQRMDIGLSGNGRRESYRHKPIVRMTNTYIAPGTDRPEEIIRSTKTGIYAARMGGGQVNTANGDFVFEVSEGYLIEDGEITVPVRGATLTGNGPDALMAADMVGSDLGYSIGTCGKDGQVVPVADAQPTLRIPELVIGGVIGDE